MESKEPKPDEAKSEAPAAASEEQSAPEQAAPADALGKTNEELGQEIVDATETAGDGKPSEDGKPLKKPNAIKVFWRKVNIYLLMFILIMIVAGALTIVSYLNSKKAPKVPGIASQTLTQEALKQLATSNTTIGNAAQTLTVQGNAVFSGQVLIRSDLNVAGNIQAGGSLQAPSLTISGKTNLADTQINALQVATTTSVQGNTTLMKDLSVAGATSFSGPVTASSITTTRLVLSGNASLVVPNHISFSGASPSRSSINQAVLGAGGSASINGSDTSGTINMNSGNNPTAGCLISITFNQPFTNQPHIIISPVGSAAGSMQYYATRAQNGFSVCSNNAAAPNQVFAFDYFITN